MHAAQRLAGNAPAQAPTQPAQVRSPLSRRTLSRRTLFRRTLSSSPLSRPALAILVAVAALALAAGALAQAVTPTVQLRYDATLGTYLTDGSGMTLYTFAKDPKGASTCTGGCATAWPPLLADAITTAPLNLPGSFSLVKRADGSSQVAYDGHPLYTWQGDKKPGDVTGQGFRGTWWVANVEPAVQTLATAHGTLLVGPTGMTLYTFAKDAGGTSACSGRCAANWPPLVGGYDPSQGHAPTAAQDVKGTLGVIKRADGAMQVTLNGKPLYYFRGDGAPGQATGDGLLGEWQKATQP